MIGHANKKRTRAVLLLWIVLFAALGGIASAAFAVAFLWVPEERSARILPHFVSFATGALLGAALLGLLPEAMKGAGPSGAHDIVLVMGVGVWVLSSSLRSSCCGGTRTRRMRRARRSMPTPITITAATGPPASWCWWVTASTTRPMAGWLGRRSRG